MATLTVYHLSLVGHIMGLTMMAGTTLLNYVMFKQFWKQFAADKLKGFAILEGISKVSLLFGIGFILLVISGVSMMAITHGVFGEQIWFRIKFVLIILIVVSGLGVGRRQRLKMQRALSEGGPERHIDAVALRFKNRFNLFHISQLLLFLFIFVLSVFKFN